MLLAVFYVLTVNIVFNGMMCVSASVPLLGYMLRTVFACKHIITVI